MSSDDVFFQLASDAAYDALSDPFDGTPTTVEPLAGVYAQGFRPGKQLPAQTLNAILSKLGASAAVGANADTSYGVDAAAARKIIRVTSAVTGNHAYTLSRTGARKNAIIKVWCDPTFAHEITVKNSAGTALFVVGNLWSSDANCVSCMYDGTEWFVLDAGNAGVRRLIQQCGTTPADLSAIPNPRDGETRFIPGFGLYVYNSHYTFIADGLLSVRGNGDVFGTWAIANYVISAPTLVAKLIDVYTGAAIPLSTGFDTTDPAGRNGGNVGRNIAGGSTLSFNMVAGNSFDIRYSVILVVDAGAGFKCDVVTGVRLGDDYIEESIDRAAQHTGSHSNGVIYSSDTAGVISPVRVTISRSILWNAPINGVREFRLDAACDTDKHGSILQSSYLQVTQYRSVG